MHSRIPRSLLFGTLVYFALLNVAALGQQAARPRTITRELPEIWRQAGPDERNKAVRVAGLDGQRLLMERILGVAITADSAVHDFVLVSDSIKGAVSGVWSGYRRSVLKAGGQFFLFDEKRGRIVAGADVRDGRLVPVQMESWRDFSPRVREISGEQEIHPLLDLASQKYGPGNYRIILLLPLSVDSAIVGSLARTLADKGVDVGSLGCVSGDYIQTREGIALEVSRLIQRDGKETEMRFKLKI